VPAIFVLKPGEIGAPVAYAGIFAASVGQGVMATFLTDRMVYLHLPKTGGTWVGDAVRAAGITTFAPDPGKDQHYSSHGHAALADVDFGKRFRVAFVRHPLGWWRSYWDDRMRRGWQADNSIDVATASGDFNEFIIKVLDHRPGYVDELVSDFVGYPSPAVDFVGRFECLTDDLCTALTLAGECFSERALMEFPRQNVSDYTSFPALYRPEVAAEIAAAEHRTIERYYPDEPIPEVWVDDSL
jgi:hypothetical protein